MNNVMERISRIGVIPVIALDDANKAVPLAKALAAGGIPAAEVTFRTAAGEESIRHIAQSCPDVLVGAGTILNEAQCSRAIAAGARFIVSPGYNEALVAYCQGRDIPVIPGCINATDMTKACNAGLSVVKFFPAEQFGGVAAIKGLAPVFPALRFMPTGGVNAKNLLDYLNYDRIVACGGTWMVKKDMIEGEQWEEITRICREAVKTMLGFSLHHVGVNCKNEAEATATARALCDMFGFAYQMGRSSILAMPAVECTKAPGLGAHGHIAIGVYGVDRAIFHLGLRGVKFLEETRKLGNNGETIAIYLDGDFCGFALHLVQK